ncbi:hypothetical protein [Providencia sp. Je.9.19]|uniref:hypothetical protein n=1 Tax=Providencia sp. Je.9.19 TaxID=3142844 RepID=UPI003DA8AB3A
MTAFQLVRWLGILSISISGCDVYQPIQPESGRFYFSNDMGEDVVFLIDEKSVVIPKHTVGSLFLGVGMHTMSTRDNQLIKFMVYPDNKGGILNPQHQLYYSYNFVHGTNGIPSIYHLTTQDVIVGDYHLKGKINSSNNYIIDNNAFNCDFAIGDEVPNILTTYTGVSQVKTKCFSRQELLDLLRSDDALISQLLVKKVFYNEKESVTLIFDYSLTAPNFTDENLQMYALDIFELLNDYRGSTDSDKKQFYYNQYHKLVSRMTRIYGQLGSEEYSMVEKQKYLTFMNQTRAIFNAGILMLN